MLSALNALSPISLSQLITVLRTRDKAIDTTCPSMGESTTFPQLWDKKLFGTHSSWLALVTSCPHPQEYTAQDDSNNKIPIIAPGAKEIAEVLKSETYTEKWALKSWGCTLFDAGWLRQCAKTYSNSISLYRWLMQCHKSLIWFLIHCNVLVVNKLLFHGFI